MWEVVAALAAVDIGKAESHSPVPRMVHQSEGRNRVMVDVAGSFQDESIIDLTSTGTFAFQDTKRKSRAWEMATP